MKFILIFSLHKTAFLYNQVMNLVQKLEILDQLQISDQFLLVNHFRNRTSRKNWMPVTDTKKKWCFHFTLPLTTDCTIFFVHFNYFHRHMRLCKIKYWQMWEKCIDNNKQETTEKLTFSQEKSVFTTTFILSPWLKHFFLLWELFAFLLPTWFMCYVK